MSVCPPIPPSPRGVKRIPRPARLSEERFATDHLVLEKVAGELAAVLSGRTVGEVVQLETHRFLIRFEEPPFPRLHVAIGPRLSTVHLARGVRAPGTTTELASALTGAMRGDQVADVTRPGRDRLLDIRLQSGRRLVVELMGKASNLLLVDESGAIRHFARSHGGAFRQPAIGAPYLPPPAPPGTAADSADETDIVRIAAGDRGGVDLARRLVEGLAGLSVHLAREVEHLVREGEDAWRAYARIHEAASSAKAEPRLYAPAAPADLRESEAVNSRNLFAFPLPLRHAAALVATRFDTMNEAEEAATRLLIAHDRYATLSRSVSSQIGREAKRCTELIDVLQDDLARAREAQERDRRRGEVLLAGLRVARRERDRVRVPDPYDEHGGDTEIPIDPALDLTSNAEKYFRSARKAARTIGIIPARLTALQQRSALLESAAQRVSEADARSGLEVLERDLQEKGLLKAFRTSERIEVGRRPEYVRVREYRTGDGLTVLVGRTGAENDHLTFKVASPHDLWLHAAGYPGAHVILCNPRRLSSLPDRSVLEAAGIAAWFSKAKSESQVDVHVAWRRHVRKGRGMSPGMVMLKRHRTVRVRPGVPARAGPVR